MILPNKNIVVGIDFSAGSERALEAAIGLAQSLSAELHVVHIFEPLAAVATDTPHTYINVEARMAEERQRQRKLCKELCERVIQSRVPYRVHVIDGMALDGLMEAIRTLKPELAVVGSHGRGTFLRMLLGSVSTALCRHSPVPVVVVPPAEQVSAAQRFDISASAAKA